MKTLQLGEKDIRFLKKSQLDEKDIYNQLRKFLSGNLPIKLLRPASIDDGIISFSKEKSNDYYENFREFTQNQKIVKFVPASGAASRMFGELNTISKKLIAGEISKDELFDTSSDIGKTVFFGKFFTALKDEVFPFTKDLETSLKKNSIELKSLISEKDIGTILEYLLEAKGLNYGSIPKALVKFHKYKDMSVSPVGEHFLEASFYTKRNEGETTIHFTVPTGHLDAFKKESEIYQNLFYEMGFNIKTSFSTQEKKTDNIALNMNNEIVRGKDGNILLRPGGHGSLISNLNKIDADIIYIRNVDNLTTGDRISELIKYKKILGSLLVKTREKVFGFLRTIPRIIKDAESINEIYCYSKDVLNIPFPDDFIDLELDQKKKILTDKLNRPIRICGMVINEKEPGGGPFWIENSSKEVTLQIVESSQVDRTDSEQIEIFENAGFFNPTDIVCSIKDFKGKVFDLYDYVEEKRYFISEKSINGESIKALEHPGLWNGGMEKWISLFVKVPGSTFNPVKSVNDLIKESHIPSEESEFLNLV